MPGAGPVPLPSAPFTPNTEDKHAVGKKKRTFCLFLGMSWVEIKNSKDIVSLRNIPKDGFKRNFDESNFY